MVAVSLKKNLSLYLIDKQKTAYEILYCDWSSDVCSSDLCAALDDMGVAYMVGSLAGDDTAFLVMRDTESAASFCEEIKEML